MQNLEWDEGIQSRFPAVLWLTWFGWFLCNMRYLYWSWNLHMCGCLMSDFLAVRVVAMCLVFSSSWADTCLTGFSKHMDHLATPNRDSLINPHGLYMLIGKRSFIFILCLSEYDQWRRKHAKDLSLIWAERSWESWHGKITLQRALPSGCLELLGDS